MDTSSDQSWTVGVVIPAFNEAQGLSRVLNVVCAIPWIQQIIVVDDGSSDATFNIAERTARRDCRVVAIRLLKNQGKAAAMLEGIQALHTDIVIFLDADLVGLQPSHIQQLLNPLEAGLSEMTIAAFAHGGLLTDVSHRFVPNLTGQRCLWRLEAEQALIPLAAAGYGVEVGLTIYARRQNWRIKKIIWWGVTHPIKEKKRRVIAGLYSRLQMYRQIMVVIARNRHGYGRMVFRRRHQAVKRARLTLR